MVSNLPAALRLSPVLEGEKRGLGQPVEHRTLKQKRHGREYSLQLQAMDKPVNHHVVVVVEAGEEEEEEQMIARAEGQVSVDGLEAAKTEAEADFEVSPKRLSRTRPPPPSPHSPDPNLLSPCKLFLFHLTFLTRLY